MKRLLVLLFVCAGVFASGAGWPQAYPSKPIRFIVPYPPGGGADFVARAIATKMQENIGQPVIIDNRAGNGEIVGTEALARAAPDGYTLSYVSNAFPINMTLIPKLPYDSQRDFIPLTMLAHVPMLLVVHPSVPATSVKELVALAKAQPGKLNYGSLGSGSIHGLGMEWFKSMSGTDIVHVPYKGLAPGMAALAAGDIQVMFVGFAAGMAQVKGGRFRALAVSPAKGVAAAPDLPSIAREGFPEFDMTSWYGAMVPAGTPAPVVVRLHAEIVKALNSPDLRERFAATGVATAPMSGEEFGAQIRSEAQLWAKIIKATGAKAE
jgi:tripartite-type tricarboxylate transporter receptor subunit TctC